MSYRLYGFGASQLMTAGAAQAITKAVDKSPLPTTATTASIRLMAMTPNSSGFALAPKEVREAVSIQMPARCGSPPDLLEGIQFPVAPTRLSHGKLYVVVWPLLKKLTPDQQRTVEQEFVRRMNPVSADYPVPNTTPCELALRKSDACFCRNRKNPATWVPHKRGNVADSMDIQSCRPRVETQQARAAISYFNQIWPSYELPFGYREVNGQPAFVWPIALNPDPSVPLYAADGSLESGNLKAKPPQYPQLQRIRVFRDGRTWLEGAVQQVGWRRADIMPGTTFVVDRWDATPLVEAMDRVQKSFDVASRVSDEPDVAERPPEAVSRDLGWDWKAYLDGKQRVQRNAESTHPSAEYYRLVNAAIDQAVAYGRDAIGAVWQTIAGLFTYALTATATDKFARTVDARAYAQITGFQKGTFAVIQSPVVEANMKQQGEVLLSMDPLAAYQQIRALRKAFQDSIASIQNAQRGLQAAPNYIAELFDGVARTGVEIKNKLDEQLVKLRQRNAKMDPAIQLRFECKMYAKARGEQQKWPRRLLDRVEPLQQAIQTYASVHPQSNAAIARYQAELERLDYLESQLNLSWWQKDYGPLPGWAWGGIGLTVFLGGAFYLRKKRRARKPKPNRRRRLPSRTRRRTSRKAA